MRFITRLIPDRVKWSVCRRLILRRRLNAFAASPLSYVARDVFFEGFHSIKRGVELYSSTVGRYTYFAERVRARDCDIGRLCSIGPEVILGELARHPTNMISTHPLMYSTSAVCGLVFAKSMVLQEFSRVTIGHDVFIGARALVLPGVNVGIGSVIAAGAVVTKDVPPYSIVAGVPARVIRYRFAKDLIDELLILKWWDWDESRLRELYARLGGAPLQDLNDFKIKLGNLT